jgi:hypothetical protein
MLIFFYAKKGGDIPLKSSNPRTMSVPSSALKLVMAAPHDINSTLIPLSPARDMHVRNMLPVPPRHVSQLFQGQKKECGLLDVIFVPWLLPKEKG